MDIVSLPSTLVDFVFFKIVPFIAVLTVVVFFHELGHFLVARWNKVKVEAFSIGFGPELFGFNDRKGTRWKVSAVPLGGYVKFLGDDGPASNPDREVLANLSEAEREGAFENKALWRRAAIVAAGPIANFILAIVIYTGLFMTYDDVKLDPVVGEILADSAAQDAGLLAGDRIVAIDGTEVSSFYDIQKIATVSSDKPLVFVIDRDGKRQTLTIAPRMTERKDEFGNTYKTGLIGLRPSSDEKHLTVTRLGPVDAFTKALDRTGFVVTSTLNFLRELVLGKQDADQLRGPLGIGQVTSQVATLGIVQLVALAAVLSISIGILNLFPVPMLDGGHLVFYAIEAVRGKALGERAQEIAYRIGLTCVLALMIFATSNDIMRFWNAG